MYKKKKLILTSYLDEAGSKMIHANIDAFMQIRIGTFPLKQM